jgi:hypothetical protein
MQFGLIIVLGLMMVAASLTVPFQRSMDAPVAVAQAQSQVDQYRMFVFVAALYMKSYSGGAGTLTWTTLRTAPGAPSGAVNSMMPSNWKVVVASDLSWVACTPMDERAIGAVAQLATKNSASVIPTQVGQQSYMVIGSSTDTSKASQC